MSEKLRLAELAETVETQRDQLRRYEGRLRDLVRAYKSLQKEKEALEASVNALSSDVVQDSVDTMQDSPTLIPRPAPSHDIVVSDTEDAATSAPTVAISATAIEPSSASEAEKTDSEDATTSDTDEQRRHLSPHVHHLKSQVATLSRALAAITSEKNKMELHFQGDKKRAKEEKDDVAATLAAERNSREAEANAFKNQVQDLRSKLRSHQLEREQEQTDHVVMLSELQTLLTQQRRSREALEQALDEEKAQTKQLKTALQAQEAMASFASRPGIRNEEEKPKPVETAVNLETHPIVMKLKKDFQESKSQLHRALQQERGRTRDAEEQIMRTNRTSEEVVRSLEDRITELSATVGTYERLRVQDQRSMETLKEELEKRLVADSTTNASTPGGRPRERLPPIGADQLEENDGDMRFLINEDLTSDPRYLLSKMKDLKTKMQVVLTTPLFQGDDVGPIEVADELFDKMELSEIHASCRREMRDLETEVSQLKEQLIAVTRQAKLESPVKISFDENESLKLRIVELEKEGIRSRDEFLQKEKKMKRDFDAMKEKVFVLEREKEEARKNEEEKWKEKLDDVLKEMKKQRDRTMSLVKQKEAEVEQARTEAVDSVASARERAFSRSGSQKSHRSRHNSTYSEDRLSPSAEPTLVPNYIQEDLDHGRELESALDPEGSTSMIGSQTLHVACREALSRVEADLRLARRHKGDLETSFRKLQNSLAMNEETHSLEIQRLNHEIERTHRNQQRASELGSEKNMEYLKNVVYRLIMSRDSASKSQLIPVVATILQFTAEEKQKSLAKYQSWWGPPSSTSPSAWP